MVFDDGEYFTGEVQAAALATGAMVTPTLSRATLAVSPAARRRRQGDVPGRSAGERVVVIGTLLGHLLEVVARDYARLFT